VCDADAPFVIDAQSNCADVLNRLPVNDFTLCLVVDAEAAVLNGTFHAQLRFLNQVTSLAATLAATSSASVEEWAMIGCLAEI
jgi:hypothetical protein